MQARIDLNLPRSLWTQRDSLVLASNTLASIKMRTSRGIDATGNQFKGYSTRPLYVLKRGARLKPKGGRLSPTGRSVFYQNGYKQYKHESRRRGTPGESAEVDLVLSGNMMNNYELFCQLVTHRELRTLPMHTLEQHRLCRTTSRNVIPNYYDTLCFWHPPCIFRDVVGEIFLDDTSNP